MRRQGPKALLAPRDAPVWLAGVLQSIERAIRARLSATDQARFASLPGDYADDAAAAAGGVPVNGLYRNGSVLMVRAS